MKKEAYLLPFNSEVEAILAKIAHTIPCFIEERPFLIDSTEVTVQARVEDFAWIERQLAEVV